MSMKDNFFEQFLESIKKVPGIKIDRSAYLKSCFRHKSQRELEKILLEGPVEAGVPMEEIGIKAKNAIKYEANSATVTSFVTGLPGGFTMFATIPADVLQYYGRSIAIIQKLMYLYGWEENVFDDRGNIDDETKSTLILYLGVMCGVKTASTALVKIAATNSAKVAKGAITKTASRALIKSATFRSMVVKIVKAIGLRSTIKGGVKIWTKMVPVFGGIFSATITMASFKPAASRLKKYFEKGILEECDSEIEADDIIKMAENR